MLSQKLSKLEGIKAAINESLDDIEFSYLGIDGSICPFSFTDISLSYGKQEKTFNSLSDLLDDPFFPNNKSLTDISEEIEINKL